MKKGFTLIELLAVIVILAIIALIAVPIILEIINDAREESNKRSVELYANAVRNGIAAHQLRTGNEVLPGTYTKDNKLPFEVEYDGDVDCTSIIISDDSKVSLLGCTVNDSEKQYSYGIEQGETPDIGALPREDAGKMSICSPVEEQLYPTRQPLEIGYKYECDVDPNEDGYDQLFYVLSYADENGNITTDKAAAKSINLIMDQNINSDGTPAGMVGVMKAENPNKYNLVPWITKEDYTSKEIGGSPEYWDLVDEENGKYEAGANDKGPITAMNFLQEATKKWINVNLQTKSTFNNGWGYDIPLPKTYKANARLPYGSEVEEDYEIGYLFGYLVEGEARGYWVDSGVNNDSALRTTPHGTLYYTNVSCDTDYGVRPVINLSI